MRRPGARGTLITLAVTLTALALAACSGASAPGPSRPSTTEVTGTSRTGTGTSSAPATATPFTIVQMTSSVGQAELLVRPKGPLRGLVVFMHGLDTDQNQIADDQQLETIGGVLVRAGYAIVSSNAHGNNLGNPVSVRDQRRAVADARRHLPAFHQVDILAFSMGGLDALLTAASHRIEGLHALALISPAVDQRTFAQGPFAAQIRSAFGDPGEYGMSRALKHSDPLLQPVRRYRGYSYRFWHSMDDQVVPASQSVTMARYLGTGGIRTTVTPLTGDHGDLSVLDPEDVLHLFESTSDTS